MAYCYATLNNIKSAGWLNISLTTYDADLRRILENASIQIDDLCHRSFQPIEGIQYSDGQGSTLMFKYFDILSLSAFKLDQDGSGNYATTITTDDYVMYPLNHPAKTHCKISNRSSIGGFASNIKAGVKLTGVFGYGDGKSATPYYLSGDSLAAAITTTTATTLTVSTGTLFSAGNAIRVDSEQMYVKSVSSNTLTIDRGCNGTTAATHLISTTIYIYSYPGPIVEATLLLASRDWKRRESPTMATVGNYELGLIPVWKGLDPDMVKKIDRYIKRTY